MSDKPDAPASEFRYDLHQVHSLARRACYTVGDELQARCGSE